MRRRQFVLKVSDEDYEICMRYGFDFNKNFEETIKEVARELREAENKTQEAKNVYIK